MGMKCGCKPEVMKMMDAEKKECANAPKKGDDLDICKITGTCKSTMAKGGKTVMESSDCTALKDQMLNDTTDADRKCIDAMVDEVGGSGSASIAQRMILPGSAVLGFLTLLRF